MSLPEWELNARNSQPDSGRPPPLGSAGYSPAAAALARALRVAVPRPRLPGDAVRDRGEQPIREAPGERLGPRPRADGDEPELMDLRLHAPRRDVVIVRVSGAVDRPTAARLLADRVGKQLHRAPHVVLDLGGVSVLDCRGVAVLSTLHQQAMRRGTQLHVVGAEHRAVRRALHATGLAQLLSLEATADAVIAALPHPARPRAASGLTPGNEDPAGGLNPVYPRTLRRTRPPVALR